MCPHEPPCASAEAPDRGAARIVAAHPEQGWNLLCNQVIVFDDGGLLLPDGECLPPQLAVYDTLTTADFAIA
jgi:Family of unknown function (DUF5999)